MDMGGGGWLGLKKEKKSQFDAITPCLQLFLFVCLHSSPKSGGENSLMYS